MFGATHFKTDTSGNTAILFAVMATAIASMLGVAVDFQRSVSAEADIQNALDATALAAAKAMQNADLTKSEILQQAEAYYDANIQGSNTSLVCPKPNVVIDEGAGKVRANITCQLPTTVAGLFNIDKVKVSRSSAAAYQISKLDLAMMLDVSGSMSGQKIKDLKTAAKDALDILITPESGDRVRVAFNTYSTAINVGSYAKSVKGDNYDKDSPIANCVTDRDGTAKFSDDAPKTNKYMGSEEKSVGGKSTWCPASSIEPLTNNKGMLKKEIDKLSAGGWTAGHLGVAWAWYLISPEWDKIWPAKSKPRPYGKSDTIKAVILMTDGAFNTYYEKQGNSNEQSEKLCKNMRDEGVIVYSVAFKAPKAGQDILKKCASSSSHYFDAKNGAELKAAYREIASQLTNLRLTE